MSKDKNEQICDFGLDLLPLKSIIYPKMGPKLSSSVPRKKISIVFALRVNIQGDFSPKSHPQK